MGTVVYVASPCAGDVTGNTERTRKYSRFVYEQGAVPVNPILNLLGVLNEEWEREDAMRLDLNILERCDEIWSFGEPTQGMLEELERARELHIPIRWFTADMKEAGGTS